MADDPGFTPIERRMSRLAAEGIDDEEIAHRFRRSPAFVQRVIALARVPRRGGSAQGGELRPLERRVLKWRADGASTGDIASRFRRNPQSIEQIERLAHYKQAK